MKKLPLFVLISLTLFVSGLHAQNPEAGTVAFEGVLVLPSGAREMGLANASIGLPNGLGGVQSNPAALGFLENAQTIVGVRSVVADVWVGSSALAIPNDATGVWAVSLVSLSEGSVEGVDENNVSTGKTWRANSASGGISFARVIWTTLSVGATAKYVYHNMRTDGEKTSASALAFDLGAQYHQLNSRFVVGLVAKNLGVMVSTYSDDKISYPLPLTIGAGLSYTPSYVPSLRICFDIEKTKGDYLNFKPGLEIAVYRKVFYLRFGYPLSERDIGAAAAVLGGNPDPSYVRSNWTDFCAGIGICTRPGNFSMDVDAAMNLIADGQPAFSAAVKFGM